MQRKAKYLLNFKTVAMKLQILYISFLTLICCGLHLTTKAQSYGMEYDSQTQTYTIYMNGGSITTNTDGQYSVTNNYGIYCLGCSAVSSYQEYLAPNHGDPPYQRIVSQPPSY